MPRQKHCVLIGKKPLLLTLFYDIMMYMYRSSYMILILILLCSGTPVVAQAASKSNQQQTLQAICKTPPKVTIDFPTPQVKYVTHWTSKQFCKKVGRPACYKEQGMEFCVKGLTVPPVIENSQIGLKTATRSNRRNMYVCPKSIELSVHYKVPEIVVYLPREYMQSSCAYRVIKEHENYHVKVFKESIPFYKPQIQKFLMQEAENLPALTAQTPTDVQKITKIYAKILIQRLNQIQEYINKTVEAKNAAIDTPEAYLAQQKLCTQW